MFLIIMLSLSLLEIKIIEILKEYMILVYIEIQIVKHFHK